jgi:hypothetical protein
VHHDDPVAVLGGEREVVGDEDRRHLRSRAKLAHEIHDRGLRGHVEPVVGSSAMSSCGLQAKRERDHHALALAAGSSNG